MPVGARLAWARDTGVTELGKNDGILRRGALEVPVASARPVANEVGADAGSRDGTAEIAARAGARVVAAVRGRG
jgi:hypothetical protein